MTYIVLLTTCLTAESRARETDPPRETDPLPDPPRCNHAADCGEGTCVDGSCDYCQPNQCVHGKCSPCGPSGCLFSDGSMSNYSCSCDREYVGDRCERVEDDPCESSPCTNGGTCHVMTVPGPNYWVCDCERLVPGQTRTCRDPQDVKAELEGRRLMGTWAACLGWLILVVLWVTCCVWECRHYGELPDLPDEWSSGSSTDASGSDSDDLSDTLEDVSEDIEMIGQSQAATPLPTATNTLRLRKEVENGGTGEVFKNPAWMTGCSTLVYTNELDSNRNNENVMTHSICEQHKKTM